MSTIVDQLKQFLSTLAHPTTEKELKKIFPVRNQQRVSALRELVANGAVIRTGLGKKANPYLYSSAIGCASATLSECNSGSSTTISGFGIQSATDCQLEREPHYLSNTNSATQEDNQ